MASTTNVNALIVANGTAEQDLEEIITKNNSSNGGILKVLHDRNAMVPHRRSEGAAGYDLAPICDGVVLANQTLIVDTGLAVEMPTNCYGRISTRSSVLMVGISISGDIDND